MTDTKITNEGSILYEEWCERLSSPQATDLMYTQDELGRAGLEVMWLKLSALEKIIEISGTGRINISRCKIKLVPTATHLPHLWNFNIEPLRATDTSVQVVLHELGLCWFRTLLVTPGQTSAEMEAVLRALVDASAGNSHLLIEAARHSQALQSDVLPIDLWQQVIQLGLRLITQIVNFSYSSHEDVSLSVVLRRVLTDTEGLRTRVQAALFVDPPHMEQDLGELLNELIRDPQWLASLGAISQLPVASPVNHEVTKLERAEEEHDIESTIIIKRPAATFSAPTSIKPEVVMNSTRTSTPQRMPAAEENLEETIIISKDKKR